MRTIEGSARKRRLLPLLAASTLCLAVLFSVLRPLPAQSMDPEDKCAFQRTNAVLQYQRKLALAAVKYRAAATAASRGQAGMAAPAAAMAGKIAAADRKLEKKLERIDSKLSTGCTALPPIPPSYARQVGKASVARGLERVDPTAGRAFTSVLGAECGNDTVEGDEQCDGTADLACPGACDSDCLCQVAAACVAPSDCGGTPCCGGTCCGPGMSCCVFDPNQCCPNT